MPAGAPDAAAPTTEQRDEIVARLRDAVGAGRLGLEELEDRLDAVVRARTSTELVALTADIEPRSEPDTTPAPTSTAGSMVGLRNGVFQLHALVWALTSILLVGIWGLTTPGELFWPFFPIAGWGIGVGAHYLMATRYEQRKLRRADRPRALSQPRRGHGRQRRYVAAMFVDIVDSTALNETIGDDGWSRLRARHRKLLDRVFADHGGEEVNVAGDGVLARFDDPRAAAQEAIDIQRRLERTRRERDVALSVRIGIHCGDVVDEGDDVVGTVVNVAARVTGAADPDEIMVTEHMADAIAGAVMVEDRGVRQLKGLSHPRHLFRLDWS